MCVCEFITRNWHIPSGDLTEQTGSPQGRHLGKSI